MADIQAIILYCSLFMSLFFEVFLLITYLDVRGEIKKENDWLANLSDEASLPSVSVVVPCFNEEKTVAATVESILNLEYPKNKLSLFLVNDGSTDGTLEVLKKFESNPQITVLDKKNGGKHTAVNLALERVSTDLVGCLDADSFVSPEALKKILPYFDDQKVMAVTPSIKVHEPKNALQHIQRVEYGWSIFLRRMLSSMGALYVTPGPFSIFRTRVFRELGGYKHAHMTEDMEMAMRMQKNRYKIVNSHGAHVYTITPATLKGLVKQRARWSYGFLNNAFDYRDLFFNRKYGNFGMFIMPIATLSTFTSIVMVGNVFTSWVQLVMQKVTQFRAIGFAGQFHFPTFDWYFINTGVLPIIVITALSLTLFILYLSLKLADGKFRFSKGLFYYLFLYAFMAPLWLIKALFDTAFRRKVSWR